MKKKLILGIAGGILVLVVVVLLVLVARLDAIVKRTVEREGSAQLKLATTLEAADVGILGGSLTLDKLAIANPQGYSAPMILELGQANVRVSYGELMDDPVRISEININAPRLVIERKGSGLGNLANINVRDMLAQLETSESQTKLVIGQVNVTDTRVVIRPNIAGLAPEYSVTIPDIALKDVGTGEGAQNGSEIGRVATEVVVVMARRAAESADLPPELRSLLAGDLEDMLQEYATKLDTEVRQRLQSELGDLRRDLGPEVDAAAEALLRGDAPKAIEDAARKVGDDVERDVERGLGDLLGGRRGGETRPTTKPATKPGG